MKFLFVVQGEGRGHMTQAISLANMLTAENHAIVKVLVGKSARREIPAFFYQKIGTSVETYESPNFAVDASNRKIKISATIFQNFLKLKTFIGSILFIRNTVKNTQPDVIVNFYELLFGLYAGIYRPKTRIISVGHQFLLNHPEFQFPKGYSLDKFLMSINTALTGACSEKYLALSFKPMPDVVTKKIYVVPPLLRHELSELSPENKGYILGYMLNAGYAEDIEEWHKQNPDWELHFFWDKKDAPEELKVSNMLTFHKLNDKKFLEMMGKCAAYSSTAGFESICEAMYLGKPIMMVPTYGHFEQACNALDATIAGGGFGNPTFNLTALVNYIPKHKDITVKFRVWADSAEDKFIDLLTIPSNEKNV